MSPHRELWVLSEDEPDKRILVQIVYLGKRDREGKAMIKGRVINSSYCGQLSFISLRKLWEPVSIYIKKKFTTNSYWSLVES